MDVKTIKIIVALALSVNATIIHATQTNFKQFAAPAGNFQNVLANNNEQLNNNAAKKNLLEQQQNHLLKLFNEIHNQEVALSLPKGALTPLLEVIINDYPEDIKKSLLKFIEFSGAAQLHLKAYKNSSDKEKKIALLQSAKKLVTKATELSSKLLEVSVGRDELRNNIVELAKNVNFEKSYNATNEFLSFSERFKFLRLIPPIVLHSLSLWENKQDNEYIFNLRNLFGTNSPRLSILANQHNREELLSEEIQNNENSASVKDIILSAAVPVLAAKYSPEEHAFDFKNLQQLICFGASIMQYLKPLINHTPRLQELFHIRKSPRDKIIEASAGIIGYGAVLGDLFINSTKKYFSKKNQYPFSQKNLKALEGRSKAWQEKLHAQEDFQEDKQKEDEHAIQTTQKD